MVIERKEKLGLVERHPARAPPPLSISPAANGPAGRADTIKESRKSSDMSLHERRA